MTYCVTMDEKGRMVVPFRLYRAWGPHLALLRAPAATLLLLPASAAPACCRPHTHLTAGSLRLSVPYLLRRHAGLRPGVEVAVEALGRVAVVQTEAAWMGRGEVPAEVAQMVMEFGE